MTDFQAAIAEFAVRQAERDARAQIEIQHLKAAVIPPLRTAGIARVEVRFDGYGDSGAVDLVLVRRNLPETDDVRVRVYVQSPRKSGYVDANQALEPL